MGAVPCLTWVQAGLLANRPEEITLTVKDMKSIKKIEPSKQSESKSTVKKSVSGSKKVGKKSKKVKKVKVDNDSGSDELGKNKKSESESGVAGCSGNPLEEKYDLGRYDEENENLVLGGDFSELAVYLDNKEDPVMAAAAAAGRGKRGAGSDRSSVNSDIEEDVVENSDCVLLLGTVNNEGDADVEMHLYNPDLVQFYVHHHYPVAAFPLALEYLQLPQGTGAGVNLLALGSMSSDVELWDLDVVNSIEPLEKLTGHRESVLSISWNRAARHALASGSADRRVILWDVAQMRLVSKLGGHKGRVQSVAWCPHTEHCLLTGCSDGRVRVYDCRTIPSTSQHWQLSATGGVEVEQALWTAADTHYCLAATSDGTICAVDTRVTKRLLFSHSNAHADSVTGIALNASTPQCLVSVSADECVKVWRLAEDMSGITLLDTHKPPGQKALYCVSSCPDHGNVFAVGGSCGACYLWDIRNSEAVTAAFPLE